MIDEGRKFLEEQIHAKTEKREASVKNLVEAFNEYDTNTSDLIAFQKALEAYSRATSSPYHPPLLVNPLNELLGIEQSGHGSSKREDSPPPPPRITKRSVVLDVLGSANGKGLKTREILAAIPENAPIALNLDDLYRALPSLKKRGKIWQDRHGRYHLGQKPVNADELTDIEALFEDTEET